MEGMVVTFTKQRAQEEEWFVEGMREDRACYIGGMAFSSTGSLG